MTDATCPRCQRGYMRYREHRDNPLGICASCRRIAHNKARSLGWAIKRLQRDLGRLRYRGACYVCGDEQGHAAGCAVAEMMGALEEQTKETV